ncbi:MAG: sulfotransferase domain-containing protein [Ekhidna sp.]|uniref:sulfotransferase domain-containing protein n=1 Tax=Ekhidna sp. TaxID=2608089 RepID=UPI0032EEFAB5
MPLPNLIIAGPPKTGTTSLFDWLAAHPEVCGSSKKETYYFYEHSEMESPFPNFKKDGWDGYKKYFTDCKGEPIRMEASPGYIYSKLAADKLGTLPALKAVMVMRNTADRMFSEYQFNRYKTKKFSGSFAEYLGFDGADFEGEKYEECNLSPFIHMWLEHIPKENFRIISFEDMKNDPQGLMKRLCDFLSIDTNFYESFGFEKKNETFGIRNSRIHQFALKVHRSTPRFLQRLITPAYYFINKESIPPISDEEVRQKEALSHKMMQAEAELLEQFGHLYL